MNATGLRDQALRVYQRTESGTDGYAKSLYVFTAWWWGRLDETHSVVRAAQDRLQMKLDAVAEFADEAVVPDKGVLVDDTGTLWWVRGLYSARLLRRVMVGLERITEEAAQTFALYESATALDGVHLLDPAAAAPAAPGG